MTAKSTPVDPASATIAAPYVNRFQLTAMDGTMVRLSFAERLAPDVEAYRSAVTMSAAAARELALTIITMLGARSQATS